MKVLVACEFSGTVRDAFIAKGHTAISIDLLPTESGTYNHIVGDVLDYINSGYGWDLMIAHPPCTYLTIAGAAYKNQPERILQRQEAIQFFKALQAAPIPMIAIENPIPFKDVQEQVGKYDQYINPFDFGVPVRKRICLWLKNLPKLRPTHQVDVAPDKIYIRKTGKKAGQKYRTYYHQGKTAHERSRFFPCVAQAMAEQWS